MHPSGRALGAHGFGALALVAAVLTGLHAGAAGAATLGVSPIRVELPADGSPGVVRVRNEAQAPTLVQVEAVAWRDDVDAAPVAGEIIAVPPVFELEGGGEQVIRLALRRPLEDGVERAYRLLITEVPQQVSAANALVFAVRLNLPVFATPKGAEPAPAWRVREAAGGEAELVLANRGSAHLRIEEVTLRAEDDQRPLFSSDRTAYALAGEVKVWPLGEPYAALPPALEVSAESHRGALTASVARPDG